MLRLNLILRGCFSDLESTPQYFCCVAADAALAQIKDKAYADKYQASGKTITGIGVNFKLSKKVIDDWKTELF